MVRFSWALVAGSLLAVVLAGCSGGGGATIDYAQVKQHVEAGQAAHRNGQFHEAIAAYDEALKLDPTSVEALVERGQAYFALGEFARAIESYNEVEGLHPTYAASLRLRAVARFEYGDPTGALADAKSAAAKLPQDADALLTLSMMQLEMNQLDEAIATCDRVLAIRPGVIEALLNRGAAYRMKREFARAEQDIRSALAAQPNNALAHAHLGAIFRDQGRLDDAVAALKESQQLNPLLPFSWFQWGWVFFDQRNYQGVVSSWSRGCALAPKGHHLRDAYARFLLECPEPSCHDPRVALQYAQEACDLTDRKNAQYLSTLAACYVETGKWDEAIGTQQEAIAASRARLTYTARYDAQLRLYQGLAARKAGDLRQAAEHLRAATQLAPELPQTHVAFAETLLAQGELPAAHEECIKALMHDPRNAAAFTLRGQVAHRQGDLTGAIRDVEQGLKHQPLYLEGLLTLSQLQIEAKAYEPALANAKLVLQWRSNSAPAYVLAGAASRGKRDFGEAARYLDLALRTDGELPAAYQARAALHFDQGEKEKAVAMQRQALAKLAKDSPLKAEYEATLQQYEAALTTVPPAEPQP